MTRRTPMMMLVTTMMLLMMASPTFAGVQSTLEESEWGCGSAVGLPAGHCISPGTVENFGNIVDKGLTFQLLVFDVDGDFVTAESATFNPLADSRPCPHDSDPRNTDGTYWEFVPGLYVCHHQSD